MFKLPDACLQSSFEFWPTFQSASYDEADSMQPAGQMIEQTVSFTIARQTFKNLAYINLLAGRKWGILILDQNNTYQLAGSRDYPLRFQANTKTGSDLADLNCLALKFTGQSPTRAIFVDKPE